MGVVVASGMVLVFMALGIRVLGQNQKLEAKYKERLAFVGFEPYIRNVIGRSLKANIKSGNCNANFQRWSTVIEQTSKRAGIQFDTSNNHFITLPNIIRKRCNKQTQQVQINRSLYFCAKITSTNTQIKFLRNFNTFVEVKSFFWNGLDQRYDRCKSSIIDLNNKNGAKSLYNIFWTRKQNNPKSKRQLYVFRSFLMTGI